MEGECMALRDIKLALMTLSLQHPLSTSLMGQLIDHSLDSFFPSDLHPVYNFCRGRGGGGGNPLRHLECSSDLQSQEELKGCKSQSLHEESYGQCTKEGMIPRFSYGGQNLYCHPPPTDEISLHPIFSRFRSFAPS